MFFVSQGLLIVPKRNNGLLELFHFLLKPLLILENVSKSVFIPDPKFGFEISNLLLETVHFGFTIHLQVSPPSMDHIHKVGVGVPKLFKSKGFFWSRTPNGPTRGRWASGPSPLGGRIVAEMSPPTLVKLSVTRK